MSSLLLFKENASVDSAGGSSATTVVPFGLSATSVESSSGSPSAQHTLHGVMEKFLRQEPRNVWKDARIKRSVINLVYKNNQSDMKELFQQWNIKNSRKIISSPPFIAPNLIVSSPITKRAVPPGHLLRPPRGNLIAPTKDLFRELLSIRKLPRSERSGIAIRLIRTLDPACPTHCDIAFALSIISTL